MNSEKHWFSVKEEGKPIYFHAEPVVPGHEYLSTEEILASEQKVLKLYPQAVTVTYAALGENEPTLHKLPCG